MAGQLLFLHLFLATLSLSRGAPAVTCDDPPSPAGAVLSELTKQTFDPGDEIIFTCLPGFMGSERTLKIICRSDGDWGAQGHCVRKKCPSLGELHNGDIHYDDLGNLFGSSVSFTCRDGFKLVGEESSECTVVTDRTMTWSKPLPVCIPILCAPPRSIEHGFYRPQKDVYQDLDVVSYECVPNANVPYSLIGNRDRICRNGSWTGEDPRCERVLCPYPSVEGGYVITRPKKFHLLGDVVQVACRSGYTLVGDDSGSTCTENSQWDPELPRCLPTVEGGTPAGGDEVVTRPAGESSTASTESSKPAGSRPSDQEEVTTVRPVSTIESTTVSTRGKTKGTTIRVTTEGYDVINNKPSRRGETAIIVVSIFFGVTFILFLCMFLCL